MSALTPNDRYLSAVLKSIAVSLLHKVQPLPCAPAAQSPLLRQVNFLNEAATQAKTSRANVSDSDGGSSSAVAAAAADSAPRIDPAHIQAALMGNRELQRLIVAMSKGGGGEQLLHSIHNVYIDCLSSQRA